MSEMAEQSIARGDGYAVANLADLGDGPGFRKIRRGLGVEAFGVNAIVLPPAYETGRHYHDEQEELYFLHSGRIEIEFGDGSAHVWSRVAWRRSTPPQPARSATSAIQRKRSTSWSGARTVTSAATAACRKAKHTARSSEGQAVQGRRERGVLRTRATEDAEMRRSSELLVDPGHHAAEVLADLLDLVAGALFAHAGEVFAAGAVLGDPLLGELA